MVCFQSWISLLYSTSNYDSITKTVIFPPFSLPSSFSFLLPSRLHSLPCGEVDFSESDPAVHGSLSQPCTLCWEVIRSKNSVHSRLNIVNARPQTPPKVYCSHQTHLKFSGPNHVSGTAEARVVKFRVEVQCRATSGDKLPASGLHDWT